MFALIYTKKMTLTPTLYTHSQQMYLPSYTFYNIPLVKAEKTSKNLVFIRPKIITLRNI